MLTFITEYNYTIMSEYVCTWRYEEQHDESRHPASLWVVKCDKFPTDVNNRTMGIFDQQYICTEVFYQVPVRVRHSGADNRTQWIDTTEKVAVGCTLQLDAD